MNFIVRKSHSYFHLHFASDINKIPWSLICSLARLVQKSFYLFFWKAYKLGRVDASKMYFLLQKTFKFQVYDFSCSLSLSVYVCVCVCFLHPFCFFSHPLLSHVMYRPEHQSDSTKFFPLIMNNEVIDDEIKRKKFKKIDNKYISSKKNW